MRATLAATYLDRGRVADAVPHLDQAAALDPSFVAAHLLRGLAHARLNRTAAAAAAYAARAKAGACVGTRVRICISAPLERRRGAGSGRGTGGVAHGRQSGSHRRGRRLRRLPIDLLDDASVDAPLFVPAAYVAGFRLLAQARYPEALASLRAAAAADPLVTSAARPTALNPADERARISKADALVASGDRAAARASLLDTVRRFPDSGQAHWRLGRLAEDDADQAAALRSYEAASRCCARGGRVDRATRRSDDCSTPRSTSTPPRAAYERRVALAPRSAPAHLDLGAGVSGAGPARRRAGRVPGGGAGRSRQRAARSPSAGQLRADLGDDEGAIALLRLAVRLDANHGEARYALGRALLRAGRADESRQELAAFERIQKAEMEAQRRSFEENSRALESALREGSRRRRPGAARRTPGEPARRASPLAGLCAALVAMPAPRAQSARGAAPAAARGAFRERGQGGRRGGAARQRRERREVSGRDHGLRRRLLRLRRRRLARSLSRGWRLASPTRRWPPGPAPAVPQPARRHVPRRHAAARGSAHRRLRHGRVRRRRGQRRPHRSLRHELRRQRAVSQRRRRRVRRRHARGGRGTLALEHQLRVPRHGPRRRPGSLRRQLPGRRRRRTTASAATRSAGFASTAIH